MAGNVHATLTEILLFRNVYPESIVEDHCLSGKDLVIIGDSINNKNTEWNNLIPSVIKYATSFKLHYIERNYEEQQQQSPNPYAIILARDAVVVSQLKDQVNGILTALNFTNDDMIVKCAPANLQDYQNSRVDIFITTPTLYEFLLNQDMIKTSQTCFVLMHHVDHLISSPMLTLFNSKLLNKDARATILYGDVGGIAVEHIIQQMMKPYPVRIFIPVLFEGDEQETKIGKMQEFISTCPPDQKILVMAQESADALLLSTLLYNSEGIFAVTPDPDSQDENERLDAYFRFQNNQTNVIVSTENTLNQINVKIVQLVVNYDYPKECYLKLSPGSAVGIWVKH